MKIVAGNRHMLSDLGYAELGAYRYTVFIERLGWDLDTEHGLERDQFDRDDTIYVVSRSESGAINGCARLLPTTQPYLLGEVFPELLNGLIPPCSEDIWELSRFSAMDLAGPVGQPSSQISSPIAVEILRASICEAQARGAKQLITVSPIGVERLLRHAGFIAHRAGPPRIMGGHPLFACLINVE